MSIEVRDSGTDKTVQSVYAQESGTDKEVQEVIVNDSGTDKTVYTATNYLDNFEDGDVSGWALTGADSSMWNAVTSGAIAGTYSGEYSVPNSGGTNFGGFAKETFSVSNNQTPSQFTFRLKPFVNNNVDDRTYVTVTIDDGGFGGTMFDLNFNGDGSIVINPPNGTTISTTFSDAEELFVEIKNIDYGGETYYLYINGTFEGGFNFATSGVVDLEGFQFGISADASESNQRALIDEIIVGT